VHFFFSYSRDDAGDPYLHRFYRDLQSEVATRGGIAPEEAGFLDVEQPTGELWPRTTGDALGKCAVFIPVYSTNFFKSSSCGQEWSAFAARSAHLLGSSGQAPKGIRPVWWLPPENAPAAAEYLEDTRDLFGADYRKYGLRYFLQLSRNADQYQDFLVKFTLMILEAAKNPPPTREITDLLAEPNAFAVSSPGTATPASGTAGRRSGPRHVTFAFAVATRAEMQGARAALDSYGQSYRDWSPYLPECPDPAALRAQGIAGSRSMTADLKPADDSVFQLLDWARDNRELVIFILDPWTAGLPVYNSLLARLDEVRSGNAAVVVPWESHEIRKGSDGSEAQDELFAVLGNWIVAGAPTFQDDIGSMDEFEEALGTVLVMIRAQVVNRADVTARVTEKGPMSRPIVDGTGS
jgi:FxsC-like protein